MENTQLEAGQSDAAEMERRRRAFYDEVEIRGGFAYVKAAQINRIGLLNPIKALVYFLRESIRREEGLR